MSELGIGIVGCGTILSVHLDAIKALSQSKLIMVCDIKPSAAEKVASDMACQWTISYQDLLANDAVEVVHILTPHYLHVPMAIEALQAGKHVVLEKPVGISIEEMQALQAVSEQSSKTIGVTFQNRFNPTTIEMKALIASGQLGAFKGAKGIVAWSRKDTYYSESSWRGQKRYEGGGLMINQAIHTLDLMEYVGGPIRSIKAMVANHSHATIDVEDTAVATLFYECGAVGNFYGTNCHGDNSNIELEFIFEKGSLRLLDQKLYLTLDHSCELVATDLLKKGSKAYWGMSHQNIIEDIYNSIRGNKKPFVSLLDAIRATSLVFACYESEKLRTEVVL